jgi:hypothetical protein
MTPFFDPVKSVKRIWLHIVAHNQFLFFFCAAYSGRKITDGLGNATVRGEKDGKSKRKARLLTV